MTPLPIPPSARRFVHLTTLGAVFLAATAQPAVAAPSDLPCEMVFPPGIHWFDYFEHIGSEVGINDDDCGFFGELPTQSESLETLVTLDSGLFAYEASYSLWVSSDDLLMPPDDKFVFFDLVSSKESRYGTESATDVIIEALMIQTPSGRQIEIRVTDDSASVTTASYDLSSVSFLITLEVTRSENESSADGVVRLLIDGEEVLAIDALTLWAKLPSAARFGLIQTDDTSGSGTLRYRPIGVGRSFPRP